MRCSSALYSAHGSHAVIARRQPRIRRYEAHLLLPREPALALDVPAVAENRVVLHDEIARRLMRRVACAEGDPCQPRLIGSRRDVVGDEADRLIDQIFGEVIAALIRARHRDARIVTHQLGRILIRLGVHETVVAIEAAAERPAVEWSRWPRLGQRRDVPFAEHVVAIAVRPQHLGNGAGLARDLAAIARIAAVEIGKAADADGMVIAPGEQGRARRRAHRRGMEGRIAQSARCDPVDRGRRNRRAIAAEIGEADVVEQNDQDIGRPLRGARRGRPERRRVLDIGADLRSACAVRVRSVSGHGPLLDFVLLGGHLRAKGNALQLAFAGKKLCRAIIWTAAPRACHVRSADMEITTSSGGLWHAHDVRRRGLCGRALHAAGPRQRARGLEGAARANAPAGHRTQRRALALWHQPRLHARRGRALARPLRLAQVGGAHQRILPLQDDDRRQENPLHPRTRLRRQPDTALDHAWLAGLVRRVSRHHRETGSSRTFRR